MATAVTQSVLLRRSNLAAKVPTTDQLQLGELGINTNDGRVFLKKDNGVDVTIEQIVVTNAEITGSINILGSGSFGDVYVTNGLEVGGDATFDGDVNVIGLVSASAFYGDGSGLTNVVVSPANQFDFNEPANVGIIGFIEDSGSNYMIAPYADHIALKYQGTEFGSIDATNGFSGSVYGIGDVLSFSSSIYTQFAAGPDAGVWA
jgi:hypothetical protein